MIQGGPRIRQQKQRYRKRHKSQRSESNRQPSAYKAEALPLSYAGERIKADKKYPQGDSNPCHLAENQAS